MAKMKAVHVPKVGADLELVEREIPKPGAGSFAIYVPRAKAAGSTKAPMNL